ncbi:glycosyltransferase family 61 protein [Candidatus Dependentiae bacterium]|nr:glycosyltransferase family 61 protein [Candidatus Dependentiae bacterium]
MKKYLFIFAIVSSLLCSDQVIEFVSLQNIMKKRHDIHYYKCHDALNFSYKRLSITPFPVSYQPIEGKFAETFVVTIPHATICSELGWINVDGVFIKDFLLPFTPKAIQKKLYIEREINKKKIKKVSGRVAVLAGSLDGIFGHWFNVTFGRFLILQHSGVSYDWIYAPKYADYMKQTYKLYGISLDKIIDSREYQYIQADELVVPSITMQRIPCATDPVYDAYATTCYWPYWITQNIRETFLPVIQNMLPDDRFAKKIFISRKDAFVRKMLNEDAVFALFEKRGFKRYCMSDFSLLEQAALFYNADYIVAAHGSALANLLFCKPKTCVVEIFQYLYDASLCNLAQDMKCRYYCIKTTFKKADCMQHSAVPLAIIENFLNEEKF